MLDQTDVKRIDNANILLQNTIRALDMAALQVKNYIDGLKKEKIVTQEAFFILRNSRRLAGEFEYVLATMQALSQLCERVKHAHAQLEHTLEELNLKSEQ